METSVLICVSTHRCGCHFCARLRCTMHIVAAHIQRRKNWSTLWIMNNFIGVYAFGVLLHFNLVDAGWKIRHNFVSAKLKISNQNHTKHEIRLICTLILPLRQTDDLNKSKSRQMSVSIAMNRLIQNDFKRKTFKWLADRLAVSLFIIIDEFAQLTPQRKQNTTNIRSSVGAPLER